MQEIFEQESSMHCSIVRLEKNVFKIENVNKIELKKKE